MPAHPRHDRGQDRDADDPVGQLEQHRREGVEGDAAGDVVRGDVGDDDVADLRDQHVGDGPEHQPAGLEQPPVAAPAPAEPEPAAEQRRQHDHAPAARCPRVVPRPSNRNCSRVSDARSPVPSAADPGMQKQRDPDADDDEVVRHRRPGRHAELLLGVQDRAEQRGDAVEEDLRQQQVGERVGQALVDRRRRRRRGTGWSAAARQAIASAVATSRPTTAAVISRWV